MTIQLVSKELEYKEFKKLKGLSLADIRADMSAVGPFDQHRKRQCAVTVVTIDHDLNLRKIKALEQVYVLTKLPAAARAVPVEFALEDVTVTVKGRVDYCVPQKLNKLSRAARKEWHRYFNCLMRHEKRHFDDGRKVARNFVKDLKKIRATVTIPYFDPYDPFNVKEAKKKALPALAKVLDSVASANRHLRDAKFNAFDLETGHGSKTGAVLNVKIR